MGMSLMIFRRKQISIKNLSIKSSTCPMTAITFDEIIDGKKGNYKVYFIIKSIKVYRIVWRRL